MRHAAPPTAAPTPASALDQLLGAERRAAEGLESARAEAERVVAQAHADAAAEDERAAAALETTLARLTHEADQNLSAVVAEIERKAADTARRYDTADVAGIAARVLDLVLRDLRIGVAGGAR